MSAAEWQQEQERREANARFDAAHKDAWQVNGRWVGTRNGLQRNTKPADLDVLIRRAMEQERRAR